MENINSILYNAAIYLQLSREDGDVAEGSKLVSNSITNQKALIMDFLKSTPKLKYILCMQTMGTAASILTVPISSV